MTKAVRLALAFPASMMLVPSADAGQSTAPVAFSAEDYGRLPFIYDPELSPNGKRILATLAAGKKQVIGIVNVDVPGSPPALVPLRDNDLIELGWINDEWFYARLGEKSLIDAFPIYVTRVVAISADGKTVRPIAIRTSGQHAEPIWTARDGSARIKVAMQKSIYDGLDFWPSVVEFDASSGKLRPDVDSITSISGWYADRAGVVRVGVGTDPRTGDSRVLYRPNEKTRFRVIDRAAVADKDKMLLRPFAFSSDGKTGIVFSDTDGFIGLYEVELETMEIGRKVAGVAGFDLFGANLNASGDGLDGFGVVANRTRRIWANPQLASAQAALEKALGKDQDPTIVSYSRDAKRVLVVVGGPDQAGSFHLFDTGSGKLNLVAHTNDKLRMERLGKVSTIRYKAGDGTQIAAVLTLPKDRAPTALPLIVMPHGGPYGIRDTEAYDWWAQFMASRGYAVVQPNYRGSGGYGRAFEKLGDGQWGTRMQDDLNDVVNHLAIAGTIDAKRVCMVGGSYGGYAAMRAAQRDGSKYRCAVSFAGVSDLVAIKSYDRSFLYGKQFNAYWKDVAPDLKAVSPLNFPAQFSTPILLVHGAKDLRVPVGQSRELASKLKAAGKPHRYVEQPEGDHHFTREDDRVQFLRELEAFLKQHNPA